MTCVHHESLVPRWLEHPSSVREVVGFIPVRDSDFSLSHAHGIMITYYINANEIPGELSCENMISLHVKIKCYFHMLKDHRCYGYIINRAFSSEK